MKSLPRTEITTHASTGKGTNAEKEEKASDLKPSTPPILPTRPPRHVRPLKVRLIMVGILALCVGLIWWSVSRRLNPVVQKCQQQTQKLSHLNDQLDRLKLQQTGSDTNQVAAQLTAARKRLFASPQAVQDWGKEIERQLAPLGLEAKTEFSSPKTYPQGGLKLAVTTARLTVEPARTAEITLPPYLRLLRFMQALGKSQKRMAVRELSVRGNLESINQVQLVVQIWSEANPRR